MSVQHALIGVATAAALGYSVSICSAACPPTTSSERTIAVTLAPPEKGQPAPGDRLEAPQVGDRINVAIPVDEKKGKIFGVSACIDDKNVRPSNEAPANGEFSIVVPATDTTKSGPLTPGDHAITVTWTYGDPGAKDPKTNTTVSEKYEPVFKPILTSVRVVPITKMNQSYRVELMGDGFDPNTKDNNLIVMDGRIRDRCWTGTATCAASPNMIRATVSGSHEIMLENVDPIEETTARFQVCYREQSDLRCSAAVADDTGEQTHWRVAAASIGVTVALAALVALLVLIGRSIFVIWGQRYILSVLLLDKETDTYSLSKLQFYIWTAVAVFGYSYLAISRLFVQHWHELPPIPSGLPGIVGIAAGATVGAQVVTQMNGPKGAGKLQPSLSDLITTGDVVAAERVQFLVWTLIGAAGFFLAVASFDPRTIVDLPDVPSSILAISGISAFGYLGGKLARDGGPLINEVMIQTGPDPDVVPVGTGQASTTSAPTAAWLQKIQVAIGAINDAQRRFSAVTPAAGVTSVLTPAKAAVDAAMGGLNDTAKLNASSSATDIGAAKIAIDKHVTDSAKGADDAGKALDAMGPAKAAAGDFAAAMSIAKIAQDAAKAAQDIQAALLTATPAARTAATSGQFGLIDLRGRMLSQDATFKISLRADADVDDFRLTFDRLAPAAKDPKIQKPRVIERDTDSNDETLAKRLLLVVQLDDKTSGFFAPQSTHTLTVTNPDSQKVVYKYDVP